MFFLVLSFCLRDFCMMTTTNINIISKVMLLPSSISIRLIAVLKDLLPICPIALVYKQLGFQQS